MHALNEMAHIYIYIYIYIYIAIALRATPPPCLLRVCTVVVFIQVRIVEVILVAVIRLYCFRCGSFHLRTHRCGDSR